MDQRPIFNTVHSINQVTFVPDVNSIEASAHGHLQIEIPAEPGIYQANIQSKEPNEELNVLLGCLRLWRCPVSAPHRWHHSRRLPSFAIILCSAGKGSYADLLLKRSKQSGRLFWLCWSRLLLQCTFRFLPTLFQTFSSEFHIAYINASMADSLTCASFVSVDYSAETKLH